MKRKAIAPASTEQRKAIREKNCLVCGQTPEPAHLIDRSLLTVGQDDPLAVVPLCRNHHRQFDDGFLSILEYLEPYYRSELAFAVERFGLLRTLNRVTNERWVPERRAA